MSWTSPCPELRWHDDRYWCGLVEAADGQYRRDLMKDLAMGAGCPSTLFNTVRDTMLTMMAALPKGILDGGNTPT